MGGIDGRGEMSGVDVCGVLCFEEYQMLKITLNMMID